MKELNKLDKLIEKQQVESVVKKQQAVEFHYQGSTKPLKGHNVYELNINTMVASLASYVKKKDISWNDALIGFMTGNYKKEVLIKKDCVYISALNKASAIKRYKEKKGSATLPKGLLKL